MPNSSPLGLPQPGPAQRPWSKDSSSAAADLARLEERVRAAFRSPHLRPEQARRIADLAESAADAIRKRHDRDVVAMLNAKLAAHQTLVRNLTASLRQCRSTYSEALAAARSGVWDCRLSDERLEWMAGVYDMFGFATGANLHRDDTTACYAAHSLAALGVLRNRAIATGQGFALDAEITSLKGQSRWIRLTAQVERRNGVAVRLFGMKQDITEARQLAEQTQRLAECDPLTGLAGRRLFEARLAKLANGALLLIDLDGFKAANDSFGHAFGDKCLKVAASRLEDVCRHADLVARIGGDEFAVLIGSSNEHADPERIAHEIVQALSITVDHGEGRLRLGASVGLARAGSSSSVDLFARADAALYAAKAAGRSTFRSFTPDMPTTAYASARSSEAPQLATG